MANYTFLQADPIKASYLYKDALAALQSASPDTAISEEKHRILLNLAATAQSLSKPTEVVEHCTASLKLQPKFARAYLMRGMAKRDLGDVDESRSDLTRALELEPGTNEAQVRD